MAKKHAGSPLTTLSHHLDLLWMREAYGRVRRDSAPGVDGQTVADYGENLDANLTSLLDRAKSGTCRAPLVRRVHIPKSETETRPIGLPTVENTVLERAVAMLLEPVYEQEFPDCSFGFRPGRSPHQAQGRSARRGDGGGGRAGCWMLMCENTRHRRASFDIYPPLADDSAPEAPRCAEPTDTRRSDWSVGGQVAESRDLGSRSSDLPGSRNSAGGSNIPNAQ